MTDPRHLETDVEAQRANVEHTLDSLKDRLSPGHMLEEAKHFVGLTDPRASLHAAADQVRAHPVAFGLIGAGLALLLAQPTRRGVVHAAEGSRLYDRAAHLGHAAKDTAHKGQEAAQSYGQAARRHLHDAQHTVADTYHAAQDKIHGAYDATRETAQDLTHRASQQMESQPLLLGAIALAAAAVVAAALPRSHAEDRWIGPAHDRLADTARQASEGLREQAAGVAQAAYTAATDAAKDEGLVPSGDKTLAERVEHVAETAIQEAKSHLNGKGDAQTGTANA